MKVIVDRVLRDVQFGHLLSLDAVVTPIDWDAWRVDNGTVDLAYMMAFHWPEERRAAQEMTLLRHYHERLTHYGITGYTWDDCLLFMLGAWRSGRHPGEGWWQTVDRGVQAYLDLHCEETV